jgi:hypothetical protein
LDEKADAEMGFTTWALMDFSNKAGLVGPRVAYADSEHVALTVLGREERA